MIFHSLRQVFCRITGRKTCAPGGPSSDDLIQQMRERARRIDAETVELRRRRDAMESAFSRNTGRPHGR